ncbi:MAG: GldG family protein [Deltaproteobacteria bacterium]|nr:GldG family protein [Deltaproteobacteria bacterium]
MKRFIPILGLLMLAVGVVSWAIIGAMQTYMLVLIWAGLLCLLFFFYVSFSDIKNILSGRSAKYGANTVLMTGVFVALIIFTVFMSIKYKSKWDMTVAKRYTLSNQTLKLLGALKKDIEAVAFYRGDERTRQTMQDLLSEYKHNSSRFAYQFIDPDKNPSLAVKYNVTSYRTTLIKSGNKEEVVGYESEEKLTNAILKVSRDEVKTIYFLKGHGENNILDMQNSGYKAVREALEKENYLVKEVVLLTIEKIPDDAAVFVISGPKKELLPDEIKKLTAYINGGGKVLFMLDPGTVPSLVSYLKDYGFKIGDDIIIDKLSQVFGANYLTPVVTEYDKDHPITKEFNVATFFPLTRSVEVDNDPTKGRYQLAKTGEASWAETNKKALEEGKAEYNDGKDKKGPVSIAAVTAVEVGESEHGGHSEHNLVPAGSKQGKDVENKKIYAKIVVFGDSDFVNNTNINLAGNKDFFLNAANWLAEEADMISIRKKEPDATPVILSASQGRLIFWLPVIIMPSLVLITGIGILTRRRQKK